MSLCAVFLNNYQDHYTSGQTIIGQVRCIFQQPKEVLGIFVYIKGIVSTHWVSASQRGASTGKRNQDVQILFDEMIDILTNDRVVINMDKGMHEYPFSYTLPNKLPTSFADAYGKIEYKIKAVVERPPLKFNYTAESNFNVITPIDLNEHAELRESVSRSHDKNTTCCWCWRMGIISVYVQIPYSGVAIGQELPLQIHVDNASSVDIVRIKCKVKKKLRFVMTKPLREVKDKISTIFSDQYKGVGAHDDITYIETILINDGKICPNFINSQLIAVTYNIEVTFVLPIPFFDIGLRLPIVVGNIAIQNHLPLETIRSELTNDTADLPPSYSFVYPQPSAGCYNDAFILE